MVVTPEHGGAVDPSESPGPLSPPLAPVHLDAAARLRRKLRFALLGVVWCGLVALFILRFRHDIVTAATSIPELRYAVIGAVALFLVWNVAATIGWEVLLRAAVPISIPIPSLTRLTLIRIQAQAVNFVLPSAGLAGESMRAVLSTRRQQALRGSVAAVMLDNVATAVAGLAMSAAALPLVAVAIDRSWQIGLLGALLLVLLGLGAGRLPFALAPRLLRLFRAESRPARFLRTLSDERELRPAFRRAVGWHLAERVVGIGEVHIVMWSLGVPASLGDSAAIAAVFVLVSLAVFFVPAQLGVAELAVAATCVGLGLPPAVGISVALVRRARQLLVCAAGMMLLVGSRRTVGEGTTWLGGAVASDEGDESHDALAHGEIRAPSVDPSRPAKATIED